MKVLVIGMGSIAQKHIYVLREIKPDVQIFALRSSKTALKCLGVEDVYDWNVFETHQFSFVLITSPSVLHLEHMLAVSKWGIPMMVEKPILINDDQIRHFKSKYDLNTLIYTACNLRFHPLIRFLKKYLNEHSIKVNEVMAYCGSYLPSWRPDQDYSTNYSAISKMGGGVHLDLIHELDYLVYLFGMPDSWTQNKRKVSGLNIDSVDTCMYILDYADFQANITLNYFRRDAKRILEIVRDNDTLRLDFVNGTVWDTYHEKLLFKDEKNSIYCSYRNQMSYFLECIEMDTKPMNIPEEAIQILKIAL